MMPFLSTQMALRRASSVVRPPRAWCVCRAISSSAHGLRVPSGAVTGSASDVAGVLPYLHELSVGARRGTPRWVPPSSSSKGGAKKGRPRP